MHRFDFMIGIPVISTNDRWIRSADAEFRFSVAGSISQPYIVTPNPTMKIDAFGGK